MTMAPPSTRLLAPILPPSRAITLEAKDNPKPLRGSGLVVKKGSNIRSRCSTGTPVPGSVTATSIWLPLTSALISMLPPLGIASCALLSRLVKT